MGKREKFPYHSMEEYLARIEAGLRDKACCRGYDAERRCLACRIDAECLKRVRQRVLGK